MTLHYRRAEPNEFEILSEIRIEAMRESLENLARFNRVRSTERFRASFSPEKTEIAMFNDEIVAFSALTRHDDHLLLDHLYVSPSHQSRGIGSALLSRAIQCSCELGLPLKLGALKGSRSNQFYQSHGFVRQSEGEWDIYYERLPR